MNLESIPVEVLKRLPYGKLVRVEGNIIFWQVNKKMFGWDTEREYEIESIEKFEVIGEGFTANVRRVE